MTDFGNGPEPQDHNSSGTDEIAASSQDPTAQHPEPPQTAETGNAANAPEVDAIQTTTSQPDEQSAPSAVTEAGSNVGAQTRASDDATGESMPSSVTSAEGVSTEAADTPVATALAGGVAQGETSGGAQAEAGAEGATAEGATAEGATAEGATAEGATAEGATAEGATAEGATAEGATAEGATAEGAPRRGQRSWRPPRLTKEEMKEIWTELQAKKEAGESIDLEVVGHNRGGVVTQYRGLEVFLPMSHWSLERNAAAEPGEIRTGSTVQANILEITDFETDARRVTATRRALLRHNVLGTHALGERLKGKVSSIHDFGIFVDLGGVDGLVHASEISHVRGRHPSELVKIGSVDVVVKEIDPQRERIYLGMKELGPSPWDNVEERFPEGSVVQGKVVGFSKNGAFVEVEPGIEGFIRMRELSWTKRVQRPKDILKKGAEIPVHVLEVSGRRQRLSLSYRQAVADPWPQIAEKYAVGTSWKGAITELSNKGVVVDIGEVEGFLPRGRMGREAKRLPDMKAGDELEVNVIEVDAERNSLIFGLPGQETFNAGGGERGERTEGGGGGGGGERRQGGGGFGGERAGGGERTGGSGGGDRGARGGSGGGPGGGARGGGGGGDRGERRGGDRRDRDRGPVVPAKAVDEIKSAETVGNFSLGDLLGDQIKSKLGIKEEPKKERRQQPQGEEGGEHSGGSKSAPAAATAPSEPSTAPATEASAANSNAGSDVAAKDAPSVDNAASSDASAATTPSEHVENNVAQEYAQPANTGATATENGSHDATQSEHSDPSAAGEQDS